MSNNNQNNTNNKQHGNDDKLRITIRDCASFVDDCEVFRHHKTSKEFCERYVNPIFRSTFKDFDGSFPSLLNTAQGPKMYIDLQFSKKNQVNSGAKYEALIERNSMAAKSGKDTFSKVQALNSRLNSSRIYDLTDEAKELLSDFNPGEKDPYKIKWKDKMVETSGQNNAGIISTSVNIITLDPIVMIRHYYGKFIKVNGQVTDRLAEYDIKVVRQIQNVYNPQPTVELLLEILCYDRANAERSIMASTGNMQFNSRPIYPAR